MTVSTAHPPPSGRAETRRAIWNTIRGSSGNLVEWYDVYVYTVFAPYFESQFFDEADQNSTIYIYAIFAVTFVTRPIGSWFFGRFADRRGRRAALTFSVSLMAACSLIVALVPGRSSIGAAAPIILILARLLQGFATGGEYGTSATYMSEAATRERRGFFSSFQYVTLVGGHVLAQFTLLIVEAVFNDEQIHQFGWRIGFAVGGVAAVVVFWLRRTMDESLSEETLAAVKAGEDREAGSMRELLTRYWKPLLLCFFITLGGTVAFYTYSVNAPAIVKAAYKSQAMTATWINLAGLIFLMALQPVGGMISDKVGRKPLLLWFGFRWALLHLHPHHLSARNAFADNVVPVGGGRLRDSDRIHVDQRAGEVRAVPRTCAGARRRGWLRAGEFDLRRHRAACVPGAQGAQRGAVVYRVCDRVHSGVVDRLPVLHQEQGRHVPRPGAGGRVRLTRQPASGGVPMRDNKERAPFRAPVLAVVSRLCQRRYRDLWGFW